MRIRMIQKILFASVLILFVITTAVVLRLLSNVPAALLFVFMSMIGSAYISNSIKIDSPNPVLLLAQFLAIINNLIITILLTTIFYEALGKVDIRYYFAKRKVRSLNRHVIITPISKLATDLADRLKKEGRSYILIDTDLGKVRRAARNGFTVLQSDPAKSEGLEACKVGKAVMLVILGDQDIKNTLIGITAKKANNALIISSRVKKREDKARLEKAGITTAVMPEEVVGMEMADFLMKI